MSKNICPVCKSTEYTFKFGKLYSCNRCKNHFYGEAPTKEEREATVEEMVFSERIKERKERKDFMQEEILRLAAEARAEAMKQDIEDIDTENKSVEDVSFKPMKSPGRPKKVQ